MNKTTSNIVIELLDRWLFVELSKSGDEETGMEYEMIIRRDNKRGKWLGWGHGVTLDIAIQEAHKKYMEKTNDN